MSGRAHAADAPEHHRSPHSRQIFNWVNIAQSVLIVTAAVVCGSTHHTSLIAPAIGLIVGLHFLPLAHAFGVSRYRLTGAALCAIAAIGAIVAFATGPQDQLPFITVGFPPPSPSGPPLSCSPAAAEPAAAGPLASQEEPRPLRASPEHAYGRAAFAVRPFWRTSQAGCALLLRRGAPS